MKFLTMEETFISTYIIAILIGIPLGFLTYWIFENNNNGGK